MTARCWKTLPWEVRDPLLDALRLDATWPGLHGFEDTVIPQLERALGSPARRRPWGAGQVHAPAALVGLLDEWDPVIEGSELGVLRA